MAEKIRRLFISRKLSADSIFFELHKKSIEIVDRSLLEFSPVAFQNEIHSDWIFFYSKNAIKFFFEKVAASNSFKYGVMGIPSATVFESITGRECDFIGEGNAAKIAVDLERIIRGGSITFIKASQSLDSIERQLVNTGKCTSLVVYENGIRLDVDLPYCELLVFTSPLNVEAWFAQNAYQNQKIFAMGASTAKKIKKYVSGDVSFCENPSEKELFNLVDAYLN